MLFRSVHRAARSGYRVWFPDVPGCVARGRSVDEAMRKARAALDRHLARLDAAGGSAPEPPDFHQVIMSTDANGVIAFILV